MNMLSLWRASLAICFAGCFLAEAPLYAADTNALGVPRPRDPRPDERSARHDFSTAWNGIVTNERYAEQFSQQKDYGAAEGRWGEIYHAAESAIAAGAKDPVFADYAAYAAQTLIVLNLKKAESGRFNVEHIADAVWGVVGEGSKLLAEKHSAVLRTRLSPEVERFLNFYEESLKTRKGGSGEGWPYTSSFEKAVGIRTALARFDKQRAAQRWQIEFLHALSLCRWVQEGYEKKLDRSEDLGPLQQELTTVGKLRFKTENAAHTELVNQTIDALESLLGAALSVENTKDAGTIFQALLSFVKDRPQWQERPLAIAMRLGAERPFFAKLCLAAIRGEGAPSGSPENDPLAVALEQNAAAKGIDALTLEVRNETRSALETAGRVADAQQLDLRTLDQCLKALEATKEPSSWPPALVDGLQDASVRIAKAMRAADSTLPASDTQIENLARASRVLVDRDPAHNRIPEILHEFAQAAELPGVSPAARARVDFEVCRMQWLAGRTDLEALERVHKNIVADKIEPVSGDAAQAYFFAALGAEKARQWVEVDDFIDRSLKASSPPSDPKTRQWQVERMLMRALAFRHTKSPAEQEQLLQELLTAAAECDPSIAPALGYAVRARLQRLKGSMSGNTGSSPKAQ